MVTEFSAAISLKVIITNNPTLANSWKHQQLSGRQHWAKR